MGDWTVRAADSGDIEVLAEMRRRMFESMGRGDPDSLAEIAAAFVRYAEVPLATGQFRAWVAESDGRTIGSVGLVVETRPPSFRNPDGRIGYLMNVYVEPERRRRGVGRGLVEVALAALRAEGVGLASLHASPEGRTLYESMGFEASSEMRLSLG